MWKTSKKKVMAGDKMLQMPDLRFYKRLVPISPSSLSEIWRCPFVKGIGRGRNENMDEPLVFCDGYELGFSGMMFMLAETTNGEWRMLPLKEGITPVNIGTRSFPYFSDSSETGNDGMSDSEMHFATSVQDGAQSSGNKAGRDSSH